MRRPHGQEHRTHRAGRKGLEAQRAHSEQPKLTRTVQPLISHVPLQRARLCAADGACRGRSTLHAISGGRATDRILEPHVAPRLCKRVDASMRRRRPSVDVMQRSSARLLTAESVRWFGDASPLARTLPTNMAGVDGFFAPMSTTFFSLDEKSCSASKMKSAKTRRRVTGQRERQAGADEHKRGRRANPSDAHTDDT